MATKKEKIEAKIVKDLSYREHPINGVFGGFTPDGSFRLLAHSQNLMPGPDNKSNYIERSLKCSLVMSPGTLKSVFLWMKNHLEHFEEKHGEIKIEQQKEKVEEATYLDPSVI
ncbi:MAG: hypothetical protein ABH950_02960 [Candidatus Altiarchaeota archaeon]